MRIAFMGTPDFAVPTLAALHRAGHDIAAVYSQPPRPAGRGKKLQPSAVQTLAEDLGLMVRHPVSLKDEAAQKAFAALELDVAIVAAYGLILPLAILNAPRLGCLNVHGSLLPRWRGAAPVQRAILAGDTHIGVTIMQMDKGLDTGAMLLVDQTEVARKTAGELTQELAQMGARLMAEVIADYTSFTPLAQPDEGVTYAEKITKQEALIAFAQDAAMIDRQIRAFNPFPGAYFEHQGERIRIHQAEIIDLSGPPATVLDEHMTIACGAQAIRPQIVQRAGKPKMPVADFLRGFDLPIGSQIA